MNNYESYLWCWLTTVLQEPDQEHCELQNFILQMGDFWVRFGPSELNWLKMKFSFGAGWVAVVKTAAGKDLWDVRCPCVRLFYSKCRVNVLEWETI